VQQVLNIPLNKINSRNADVKIVDDMATDMVKNGRDSFLPRDGSKSQGYTYLYTSQTPHQKRIIFWFDLASREQYL
jgi:hypothetical protein